MTRVPTRYHQLPTSGIRIPAISYTFSPKLAAATLLFAMRRAPCMAGAIITAGRRAMALAAMSLDARIRKIRAFWICLLSSEQPGYLHLSQN